MEESLFKRYFLPPSPSWYLKLPNIGLRGGAEEKENTPARRNHCLFGKSLKKIFKKFPKLTLIFVPRTLISNKGIFRGNEISARRMLKEKPAET